MKAIILTTGVVLSLGLSTACAKTDSEPQAATKENVAASASVANTDTPPAAAPAEKKAETELSQGMQIPVDGSSLESFEQSLENIKAKATEAEYESLTHAINYLMVYDIGARRDRTKLALRLDGLTGEEILGRVKWDPKQENSAKKKRKRGTGGNQ